MRCLVVLMLVAACFAEPPSNKENSSSESKDKRGAISYDHGDAYHGTQAAIALPATSLGYGALGHSSLLLPQTAGLGYLGHSGLHSAGLLASPIALGGHGLALSAQPIVLGHGLAAHNLGGLGYSGYGLGGLGGLGGLSGLSGLSLASIPASSLKLSSASLLSHGDSLSSLSLGDSYSSHGPSSYHGASLTPPSKSYGVPSSNSYSSGFQPSHSSYSSYSGSNSYSSPSSSYGPPSSSYGPPSSSYGVPSSHSSDYNTLPYSSGSHHSSRDYRSH